MAGVRHRVDSGHSVLRDRILRVRRWAPRNRDTQAPRLLLALHGRVRDNGCSVGEEIPGRRKTRHVIGLCRNEYSNLAWQSPPAADVVGEVRELRLGGDDDLGLRRSGAVIAGVGPGAKPVCVGAGNWEAGVSDQRTTAWPQIRGPSVQLRVSGLDGGSMLHKSRNPSSIV